MRSMRLTGPHRLDSVEAPAPTADDLQEGDVLLRVLAGGICGTDIPYFRGLTTPYARGLVPHGPIPGFPLHEVVGEVMATRFDAISAGEVVVGWASRYDGLSEVIAARGDELHRYTSALPPRQAVLIQPLACVLYALEQVGPLTGRRATVIGLGSIGSLFGHVLAGRGAIVEAVDIVDRREVAVGVGAHSLRTMSAEQWAAETTPDHAPDLVIEAVGHQPETFGAAIGAAAVGGEIYAFGIPDDDHYAFAMGEFMRKGLVLRGGFTQDRARVLAEADRYLAQHPELADLVVSDVYAFADAQRAFERAERYESGRLKVVLAD